MHSGYSHWPEATQLLGDDIVVGGTSLRGRVEAAGTPVVVEPASSTLRSAGAASCPPVLVTQVLAVDRHFSGRMVVQLDCRLDRLPFIWSEARLLSRSSGARTITWLVVRRPSRIDMVLADDVVAIPLPADLRLGDLLALPGRTLTSATALRSQLS
jgi:hypothetical protein